MLVFEPEITRILKSEVYYVASSEGEPIDKEELMETVKATLPDSVAITGDRKSTRLNSSHWS